jgi:hypothetical protein
MRLESVNIHPPNLLAEYQTRSSAMVLAVRIPYQRFFGTTPRMSGIEAIKKITAGTINGELIIISTWMITHFYLVCRFFSSRVLSLFAQISGTDNRGPARHGENALFQSVIAKPSHPIDGIISKVNLKETSHCTIRIAE